MKIFSTHRKLEPKRRFGSMEFRNKIKQASNYKRAFNPTSGFSLNLIPGVKLKRSTQVLGIGVLLTVIFYLTISTKLAVTQITVKGNRQVSTEEIENILTANGNSRMFLIKKNNFFLMSDGRVNELLTQSIPTIKRVVRFNRQWPDKATIEIAEHAPGFVIESNKNYFLVDDEGIVVQQIEDPKRLLVVQDQLVESFARAERMPSQKLAPFILSISKAWSSKINTPLVSAKFPGKSSSEIQFVTQAGWSVMFDANRSSSVQLSDLAVILNKQISADKLPNLAYIDLRSSKSVYYCFKETPCEQQEQPTEAGTTTDVKP